MLEEVTKYFFTINQEIKCSNNGKYIYQKKE